MTLRVASEAEKRARDLETHAAWGERLSVEAYARREARLREHPFARRTMTTWLWCGADGDAGEVLASCETYRMESWLDGRPGGTHAVASVFVAPALRGRGHATAMMRALVERLRETDAEAHASVLYSDVGTEIYARAGYVPRVFPYRVLGAAPGDPARGVDALVGEHEVVDALARAPWPDERFLVRPSADQIDWHLERERVYTDELAQPRPPAAGARAGDALLLWYLDRKADRLEGLLLLSSSGAGVAEVLLAGRRVAQGLGLPELRLWTSPADPPWPPGEAGGTELAHTGSLAMIAPLCDRLDPTSFRLIPRALWV